MSYFLLVTIYKKYIKFNLKYVSKNSRQSNITAILSRIKLLFNKGPTKRAKKKPFTCCIWLEIILVPVYEKFLFFIICKCYLKLWPVIMILDDCWRFLYVLYIFYNWILLIILNYLLRRKSHDFQVQKKKKTKNTQKPV